MSGMNCTCPVRWTKAVRPLCQTESIERYREIETECGERDIEREREVGRGRERESEGEREGEKE